MTGDKTEQDRWQAQLVDHSQFPRRHGRIEGASIIAAGDNPICGDRVRLYLQMDEEDRISDARFEGTGCAISQASASILTAQLPGRSRRQALEMFAAAHVVITGGEWPEGFEPGELAALGLVRKFPMRVKCASLAWHALRHALEEGEGTVTTE